MAHNQAVTSAVERPGPHSRRRTSTVVSSPIPGPPSSRSTRSVTSTGTPHPLETDASNASPSERLSCAREMYPSNDAFESSSSTQNRGIPSMASGS